ncbi:ReoY family proteolytic degradation factor [Allobacillus sp. GCM10007491]|uniref:YpiB family protein n=2 Tax=Allobacillus TaxID=1400133 RepID=A0A941CSS1_9BACI|nr:MULTISPECIES: ReoY family proteolytic degradation factor [Allobacillus]MBR7553247.1 YpiB family protein [Allobacillus saliphilus]TSJ67558.1 IDEAL domain-containing protein [Allobacillus salarius]
MQVPSERKKAFIEWFLTTHPPEQREVVWLLQYILKREQLLNGIHFIYEAHLTPRSIIVSTEEEESRPFRFYKEHIVTTDVDKAFHDIRLNQDQELFIEFIYEDVRQSAEYADVLEENPYLPDDYYLEKKDYNAIEKFLEETSRENEKKSLQKRINEALDQGDEEAFLKWSKLLNNLDKEHSE